MAFISVVTRNFGRIAYILARLLPRIWRSTGTVWEYCAKRCMF
jgi:hypothetical protein